MWAVAKLVLNERVAMGSERCRTPAMLRQTDASRNDTRGTINAGVQNEVLHCLVSGMFLPSRVKPSCKTQGWMSKVRVSGANLGRAGLLYQQSDLHFGHGSRGAMELV